ncbi:MAG: hypothetical protein ACOC10_08830, partial [Bacteroidota bacterium]
NMIIRQSTKNTFTIYYIYFSLSAKQRKVAKENSPRLITMLDVLITNDVNPWRAWFTHPWTPPAHALFR